MIVPFLLRNVDLRSSVTDKDLEREMVEHSRDLFGQKTLPGLYFSQNMGNMYTPSLYFSLFAYLSRSDRLNNYSVLISRLSSSQKNEEQLYGRRILLFSYGSGLASSMYSVVCRKVHECRFTLGQVQKSIQRARYQLDHERIALAPYLIDKLLFEREKNDHQGKKNRSTKARTDLLCFVSSVHSLSAHRNPPRR